MRIASVAVSARALLLRYSRSAMTVFAHAIEEEVPEAAEDAAQEACDGCPVTAIELD